MKGLFPWPHPGTTCNFRGLAGPPVRSPAITDTACKHPNATPSECRAGPPGHLEKGPSSYTAAGGGPALAQQMPVPPHCKYHAAVPWTRPENKAEGSSPRPAGEAWLRLALWPRADVGSSPPPLGHALHWAGAAAKMLSGLQAGGWGAATANPGLLASRALQVPRRAEGGLSPGDLTAGQKEKAPHSTKGRTASVHMS